MSRFIYCTDQHFRSKTPANRTDDILESLIKKMNWVIDYAVDVDADRIILGGDLFHISSPSDIVANKVRKCLNRFKNYFFILGNHDVIGNNAENKDKCKIGLFYDYDWFYDINDNLRIFDDCNVYGLDFSKELECPENLMIKEKLKIDNDNPLILVVHSMITNEPQIAIDGKLKTIHYQSITTDADMVLTGHYHPGFGIVENTFGTIFANPGAMVRQEASKEDLERIPSIIDIKISNGKIKAKVINIECSLTAEECFDLKKIKLNSYNENEKNLFVNALEEMSRGEFMSQNIEGILDSLQNKDNEKEINRCRKKIKEIIDSGS